MRIHNLILVLAAINSVSGFAIYNWLYTPKKEGETFSRALSTLNVLEGEEGYYYATSYFFPRENTTNATESIQEAYIGLQHLDSPLVNRLIFSFFGTNSTTTSPNCNLGADGGDGVSCRAHYPWEYGKNYTTEVVKTGFNETDGLTTWTGYFHDFEKNATVFIGEISFIGDHLSTVSCVWTEWYFEVPSGTCLPKSESVRYYPHFYDQYGGESTALYNRTNHRVVPEDDCAQAANTSNQRAFQYPGKSVFQCGFLPLPANTSSLASASTLSTSTVS